MKKIYLLGLSLMGMTLSSFAGPPPLCSDSYSSITVETCDSYVSPSGKIWITSGTRMDTIPNEAGCDSIITINLTFNVDYVTSTVAGVDYAYQDGTGTNAYFGSTPSLDIDASGNVYVADAANYLIRKITSSGVVTTFAGKGNQGSVDGTGTSASFAYPFSLSTDASGNIYIGESYKIRKISSSGVVTTLAGSSSSGFVDGTGASAQFNGIYGLTVDNSGNIYAADKYNHCIRKVTPAGVVTTLAGSGSSGYSDGTGTTARFNNPHGITVDGSGNVYVSDQGNARIRKISSTGVVTTVAGNGSFSVSNGTGSAATFYYPAGMEMDASGNVYIASSAGNIIRKMTSSGVVTSIAGRQYQTGYVEGSGTNAKFNNPNDVCLDAAGNVYVADRENKVVRKINTSNVVSTFAGFKTGLVNGAASSAQFSYPYDVVQDASGNIYVSDMNNHVIRKITPAGVVSTFAGSGTGGFSDGTGTAARFNQPRGIGVDSYGNVYVADYTNHKIRKITPSGVVTTFAGTGSYDYLDGSASSAKFRSPNNVAVDKNGDVYVSDMNNHRIRKISGGIVSTVAGNGTKGFADGTAGSSSFDQPQGVALDGFGNIYVCDRNRIRKITQAGMVSTVAGSSSTGRTDGAGTNARFRSPKDIESDDIGNLYIAGSSNLIIRVIDQNGVVSTIAGNKSPYASIDGTGTQANFRHPNGLFVDQTGNIYVAESNGNRVRKITRQTLSSESEIEVSAYNSYTSPSGNHIFTESGDYMDTIANAAGCDSVISIELTIHRRLFVDAGMGSSGTGGTWGTSFKTLKEALDSINNMDAFEERIQIWIKSGTYYAGGSQTSSNRNTAYVISNLGVELYGGFSGVETSLDQRNTAANPTTLCGDLGKSGDSSDNAFHVIVLVDERTTYEPALFSHGFVIDGVIIRDGNANGGTKYTYRGRSVYQTEGGAISIIGSGVSNQHISPTISNCHFENNYGAYGSIYMIAPNAKAQPNITNCTFKGNRSIYGTIFNDGTGGEASPKITNCAFVNNLSLTSGAAIYNYGYNGKASPSITSCVFNGNNANSKGGAIYNTGYIGTANPIIFGCTFHANNAGSTGGAMYSFGNAGTSKPGIVNSIFYKNSIGGNADHKFSEFHNYQAYPKTSYSSMQRASSTYTAATANSLNGGTNNLFQNGPKFEAISDPDGADNIWRTGDDGIRLSSASPLLDTYPIGDFGPRTDILGNERMGYKDMGAYEYVNCGLHVKLATSVKTHVATQTVEDDGFICYCNSDNELLLALDTTGTGAVITPSQVQLYIGNPTTLSYNTAGGMITNTAGGVVLERRWDVDPTTQPSSPVTVRYFYTHDNYDDIVSAMAGLTSPTAITSPSELQFYKVTGGSTATFPNPHNTGVTGIILANGSTASTTVWVNGTHGVQDHSAEYLVSTFSGGGGGGGGGSEPLPVELIQFEANASANHTADLTWKTASELNNSHFIIERTYDGITFDEINVIQGNGTTVELINYNEEDITIDPNQNTVYYRLRQVDFDATEAYSPIRRVDFETTNVTKPNLVTLYPNPTNSNITVAFSSDEMESHTVKLVDQLGRVLTTKSFDGQTCTLDLSHRAQGVYFVILDSGESFKVVKE
ncbi:MAG: sugar lactone lactonase YvrE [Bacteroidia bacterium]|jgi:sugar lactone lactonase YvrE